MYVPQAVKDIFGSGFVPTLRAAERVLPLPVFHALLYPYILARALQDPRPFASSLPISPSPAPTPVTPWGSVVLEHTRPLEFLSDRMQSPRWRKRCEIIGLDRLLEAHRRGPVVLTSSHIGPINLTGFWLRAHGAPITTLRFGSVRHHTRTQRQRDAHTPCPDIPAFLYTDQLRELVHLLSKGGMVKVDMDNPTGRLLDVPIGGGRSFRMATGALRLAAQHDATLLPCNIGYEGSWRFRLEIGEPVPKELLGKKPDLVAAGQHLIAQMMPHWVRYANQSFVHLLMAFQPNDIAELQRCGMNYSREAIASWLEQQAKLVSGGGVPQLQHF